MTADAERVAVGLWEAFEARDWERAGSLLAEDVVVEWPQSRERIRGRENVLALNRNYPGDWHIHVESVVAHGARVVTRVRIEIDGAPEWGISFFDVRDGRIARAVEHWAAPYAAPEWRRRWVEALPSE